MPTPLEAANLALDALGEAALPGPGPFVDANTSIMAERVVRHYDLARDLELRAHLWGFARHRARLTAHAGGPAFGWRHSYTLPADWVRLLPLTGDGSPSGAPVPYELEGSHIMTDHAGPLLLRYVRQRTSTDWPAPFTACFALRLAHRLATVTTGLEGRKDRIMADYDAAAREARRVGAIEAGDMTTVVASSWLAERADGRRD